MISFLKPVFGAATKINLQAIIIREQNSETVNMELYLLLSRFFAANFKAARHLLQTAQATISIPYPFFCLRRFDRNLSAHQTPFQ